MEAWYTTLVYTLLYDIYLYTYILHEVYHTLNMLNYASSVYNGKL